MDVIDLLGTKFRSFLILSLPRQNTSSSKASSSTSSLTPDFLNLRFFAVCFDIHFEVKII